MGGVSYRYNGMGQRVEQTVGANTTQYTLDVALPLWEVLAATTGANTSFYAHDPLGLLIQQDAGGVDWMLVDGLGSMRAVVNGALMPLESRLYTSYGEPSQLSGSSQSSYGFTGEPTDSNGLVHLRARYYRPSVGSFLNLDPLESVNRYGYVSGNPANQRDPSGWIGVLPKMIDVNEGYAITPKSSTNRSKFSLPHPQSRSTNYVPGWNKYHVREQNDVPQTNLRGQGSRARRSTSMLRQATPPTAGAGIDACGLYAANAPSLVTPCRMGWGVPEPHYEVIFFSGLGSGGALAEGPDPYVQAPVWANWATNTNQTFRYPGVGITEVSGKEGQAFRANLANRQLRSSDYLIVVGYSAGADAALMFASRYEGSAFISDVVLLGGTMTGSMTAGSTLSASAVDSNGNPVSGASNIRDNRTWQGMIEDVLDRGTDVFVFDDDDLEIQPDYSSVNPIGRAGRFDYVGPIPFNNGYGARTTVSADPMRAGVFGEGTPHYGDPGVSPIGTNHYVDLLQDVIYWINNR